MRLTCPNCGAEYEVPDEVIPTAGRDVQCSNCGDTWYQYHHDHMPDGAGELDAPENDADLTGPDAGDSGDDVAPDPDDDYDETYNGDFDEDYEDEDEPADVPERPALRRRALDPEVQSILREEAQFEERARGYETLESQPDLGLGEPEPPRREEKAEGRLSRLREQTRDDPHPEPQDQAEMAAAAAAAGAASRRNLLPDIEEINSTLRRKGETMRGGGRSGRSVVTNKRNGTRRGFVTVVVILALGAALYLQAPNIGNAVPQLKGAMTAYVDTVDRGRAWLDRQAASLAAKLDEMSGDPSDGSGAAPAE